MIVRLEESKGGGLMAEVDEFVCFFDRRLEKELARSLSPGDEVEVMFVGRNRRGSVLFMAPVRKDLGHRLVRHDGFRLMGRGMSMEIMARISCPAGLVFRGRVPIPAMDGANGMERPRPGYCWAAPARHNAASWTCVGAENPWNLFGLPTEMP